MKYVEEEVIVCELKCENKLATPTPHSPHRTRDMHKAVPVFVCAKNRKSLFCDNTVSPRNI